MSDMIDIETLILSFIISAIFVYFYLKYQRLYSQFKGLKSRYDNMDDQFKTMLEFQGQNSRDIRELKGLK
jgi:hypothetical protein